MPSNKKDTPTEVTLIDDQFAKILSDVLRVSPKTSTYHALALHGIGDIFTLMSLSRQDLTDIGITIGYILLFKQFTTYVKSLLLEHNNEGDILSLVTYDGFQQHRRRLITRQKSNIISLTNITQCPTPTIKIDDVQIYDHSHIPISTKETIATVDDTTNEETIATVDDTTNDNVRPTRKITRMRKSTSKVSGLVDHVPFIAASVPDGQLKDEGDERWKIYKIIDHRGIWDPGGTLKRHTHTTLKKL
jgi:hypothetical protein